MILLAIAFLCLVSPTMTMASGNESTPARQLIARIGKIQSHGIMFGHQDDTFYGHEWHGDKGRSDVLETAGDYPAVMGFELGGIENGDTANIDHVPFDDMRSEIIAQHERGGIATISWHCHNLVSGKTAWDPQGGETAWLLDNDAILDRAIDSVGRFIASLGAVPVIFRPWHEMNGDWFWWGGKNTTTALYKRLYRHIHDKLEAQCLGQIVWAFSPNLGAKSMDDYYPGDDCVDLVGIDIYDFNNDAAAYSKNVKEGLDMICSFAKEHHKIAALTETGCQQLPQDHWFTKTLWQSISGYPIAYVLLWRNAWDNVKELYASYHGHYTEPDFKAFAGYGRTLFVNDIKNIR